MNSYTSIIIIVVVVILVLIAGVTALLCTKGGAYEDARKLFPKKNPAAAPAPAAGPDPAAPAEGAAK
ncbi:hypothetical protein M569_11306 [Genlisea aurea]|uniref:Uncharacterized protein n=1 Tax=Genlisea aurea TaxID=192259 RepID=S8C981_9LAMI|nr:hypothetical protein M569_11306 [Genlisea aurea]